MAEENNKAESGSEESKHDRFKRLLDSRVEVLRDKIRLLANLSNRKHYDYTKNDIEAAFGQIEQELRRARNKFDIGLSRKRDKKQ